MDIDEAFRTVDSLVAGGRAGAGYYPYRGLKHTWRIRDGRLAFRISDYMRDSPTEVVESLAWFLVCRARGKECPGAFASKYLDYVRSTEFWRSHRSQYMSRARNLSFKSSGDAHNLAAIVEYVIARDFQGEMEMPDLAWTRDSPSRRMAFFHRPLGILAVNRVLDSEHVPRFVLEFVVYHELLHGAMGCRVYPDRSVYHTKEFRKREREFAKHDEAQVWLARIASASRGGARSTEIVPQV